MTISLLLVVMRILTVTTRSKLEIIPVSGAPAAQHEGDGTVSPSQLPHQHPAMSQRRDPSVAGAGNAS